MSRRWLGRCLAAAAGALALLVLAPGAASAHPLGNFTVNRYSGLVVAADSVAVEHVLDLAEIPTAQRFPGIDRSSDGVLSPVELDSWAAGQCRAATGRLQATVGGRPLRWQVVDAAASTAPGQAGLPVLRLDCRLRAPALLSAATSLRFSDAGAGDQVGWREVTARGDGVTLARSDVPVRSVSDRLSAYPEDLLASPLDVGSARLALRPGGGRLSAEAPSGAGVATVAGGVTGSFQNLATRYDGSPLVAITALLAAVALGAGHSLAPGHGKTIMAFYLSGRREGSLRAAGTVGATVTATHTAAVLLLGLLVSAGTAFVPARVYPWLTVLSGGLVVLVGLTLLRAARAGGHVHGPGGHTHGPAGHEHGSGPAGHEHDPAGHDRHPGPDGDLGLRGQHGADGRGHGGAEPGAAGGGVGVLVVPDRPQGLDHHHPHPHAEPVASRRGLVAMGLAGGLLPSPSAVLVFLGALAVGHPWFGVLLVVAFGVGMATTLAVVGVLVIRLRERVEGRLSAGSPSRFRLVLRVLPVLTAIAVTGLGAVLALHGLASIGA